MSEDRTIPLTRTFRAPGESANLEEVLARGHAHGDGRFTASATGRLRALVDDAPVLLTTSGTDALEMASRLLDLGPGDEVVLPTFTFPSAANAIALTGATIVFVDVEPTTGNIDVEQAVEALTPRTRAVSVMHYGGVPVDLEAIADATSATGVPIVEDNAHGLGVRTPNGVLGTRGVVGVQSFHDTKNVHAGEGGALIVSDRSLLERAEIMREKGTDRSRFLRGEVDKYSWVDVGSSSLMSELNAAVLDAQLASFDVIQTARHAIWNRYAAELPDWADRSGWTLMQPPGGVHAAHLFWMLAPDQAARGEMLRWLVADGIAAAFHYVPLHSSRAGMRFGRTERPLLAATDFSERLVRLPLWPGMTPDQISRIVERVARFGAAEPRPAPERRRGRPVAARPD